MSQVTAYPTVEWLKNRTSLPNIDRSPEPRSFRPGCSVHRLDLRKTVQKFQRCLTELATPATSVKTDQWVQTPDGEFLVDVVVSTNGRRVGIRFSGRYESGVRGEDAVVMVYGRFDAMYRVRGLDCSSAGEEESIHDVISAIVCDRPTWFSALGRLQAGRRTSSAAILSLHAGSRKIRRLPQGVSLERLRFCVASEWVERFEETLGANPPDQT